MLVLEFIILEFLYPMYINIIDKNNIGALKMQNDFSNCQFFNIAIASCLLFP